MPFFGAAAYGDCFPAKAGIKQHLYRSVETVQVTVQNDSIAHKFTSYMKKIFMFLQIHY